MASEKIRSADGKRNKADVSREKIESYEIRFKEIKEKMVEVAKLLQPLGFEYAGLAAVFLFEDTQNKYSANHNYVFCSQTLLEDVPEGQADVAFKELKKAMMEAYGREEPKTLS